MNTFDEHFLRHIRNLFRHHIQGFIFRNLCPDYHLLLDNLDKTLVKCYDERCLYKKLLESKGHEVKADYWSYVPSKNQQ